MKGADFKAVPIFGIFLPLMTLVLSGSFSFHFVLVANTTSCILSSNMSESVNSSQSSKT